MEYHTCFISFAIIPHIIECTTSDVQNFKLNKVSFYEFKNSKMRLP